MNANFLGLLVQNVDFIKQSLEMVWEFVLRLKGTARIILFISSFVLPFSALNPAAPAPVSSYTSEFWSSGFMPAPGLGMKKRSP